MIDDDDPFAESTDTEKTVVNLRPGRRAPAAAQQGFGQPQQFGQPQAGFGQPQQPQQPPQQTGAQMPPQPAARAADTPFALTGMNPLNAAASQIFALIGRIRNRAQHNDPGALRNAVVAEIQEFERRAMQAGVPAQTVNLARYTLCATIDDVVLNTPWGGRSIWTTQSMVGTFHKETHGGDRFYDVLARLEREPANNLEMLEFIYVCLSLGFEGRLRVENQGADKHLRIREGLARLIRTHRGDREHALSPMWKGLKVAHKALNIWLPLWIITGVLVVVLAGAFFGLTYMLNGDTERLQGQLAQLGRPSAIELSRRAPPPPPPPPAVETEARLNRVAGFLEPEIAQGIVEVFEKGNTLTVRIAGATMFGPGRDVLQPGYTERLQKVAAALNDEEGMIIVAGHSDSDPISNARFPNNQVLSLRRAEAVMEVIAASIDDPSRLTAEGRADSELILDENGVEDKSLSRRVEVILVK